MAECPSCHGVLEQADIAVGKCLVCGAKLPKGMTLHKPAEKQQNSLTKGEVRHAATVQLTPPEPGDADSEKIPGSHTHIDPRNSATFALDRPLDDSSGQVAPLWEGMFDSSANPRTSLGRADSNSGGEPDLVIQPRVISAAHATSKLPADYELLGQLGQGGMGVVLAARQASVNRTVALKKIGESYANDPETRRKFLTEAVVTGDLEHPNIVPIYDLGKDESGGLFYSMKHVKGTPWDQVISKKSLSENVEILMKVADAVAFAHSRNVVHRDLKPENVMLGGYGEVLLMDWGLAIKLDSPLSKGAGMGGTPAYMAPEMIFTPPERINFLADVYLLGAILYEIVTGFPPHDGATVSACLVAAGKNFIRPTDKTDELVTIALHAMATEPADRYASVEELQEAIRQYWSHSQSVLLSNRAAEDLKTAEQREDYERYARALLGFQEAYELWEGNTHAKEGIAETSLAYAKRALSKSNFDLAASLLDDANPDHTALLRQIRAAQKEQDARQQRLRAAKRLGVALMGIILTVVTVAFVVIRSEYKRAESAKAAAEKSETIAISEKKEAQRQKSLAEVAEEAAIRDRNAAETSRRDEAAAKGKAIEAKNAALEAKNAALAAKEKEQLAKEDALAAKVEALTAKEKEEYGAYIARIGLASAKIDDNAFGMAETLLKECPEKLRNWEWGRLNYLCRQSDRTIDVPERVETIAISPDGKRFVTGGLSGTARIWNTETGKPFCEIRTGAQYIFAAAFSPDGRYIALGTNEQPTYLKIYDTEANRISWQFTSHKSADGQVVGHEDAVLSVVFSRDGKRLLTSSYDNTARLWDLERGEQIRVFRGHDWWVWSAAFSPDEQWIVTASQDGSAIVWDVDSAEPRATFRGHSGPVYTAAFAPDGTSPSGSRRRGEHPLPHVQVASGGYDKNVFLWWPDKIRKFNYDALARPESEDASSADARLSAGDVILQGHTAGVRSVAFSSDGQLLATGSNDNTVCVWGVGKRQLLKILRGHGGRVRAVAFNAVGQGENRLLFSAGHDQQVRIWNLQRYEEMRIFKSRLPDGSGDAILGAEFSPNGEQIVTAGRDRTARLWDRDGQTLLEFRQGHQYLASNAIFFPDKHRLLTAAMDGTSRIWDLTTGGQMMVLKKTGASAAIALSHDGKQILSGGNNEAASFDPVALGGSNAKLDPTLDTDGKHWVARLWNADTGESTRTLSTYREVTAVAFSPDDQLLFAGDASGNALLWDARNNFAASPPQKIHVRGITAAAFLPDGSLVTAGGDNVAALWDVGMGPNGAALTLKRMLKHPDAVSSIAVSPDGTTIVTTCSDKVVRFWNAPAGQEIAMILAGRDHKAKLMPAQAASEVMQWRDAEMTRLQQEKRKQSVTVDNFTSDEQRSKAELRDRQFAKMEQLITGVEEINSVNFSPDGHTAVTTATNGNVRLWDWRNDREIGAGPSHQVPAFKSAGGQAWSTTFAPSGAYLVTAGGSDARLWRRSDGVETMRLGPQGAVSAAHFSPDGKRIVTSSWDSTARIWNAQTGHLERELQGHSEFVNDACFSADGKSVLTASDDKTAILWDAESGNAICTFKGHSQRVRTAKLFCENGTGQVLKVLTASDDATARIWSPDGKPIRALKAHANAVLDAEFSPDGKFIITCGDDNRAILWDAESGAIIRSLEGHTAGVTSVAFSPDGTRAVTGSRDNSVKVWELKSGKELLTLKGHTQEVTSVSFSPDQKTILTAGLDGAWIQWRATDWRGSH